MRPVVLVIRDGWGINPDARFNAVANARTPNMDRLVKSYPNAVLRSAGLSVGLPDGYQGSSEVGHLNIGAGRIVQQELTRINEAIEGGLFFRNARFRAAIENCKANNGSLHLTGLVQDEGVHAHQDHLFAIMKFASEAHVPRLYIHFFADGRDTSPRSAPQFYRELKDKIKEYRVGEVATIMGRYYAMDRSGDWELTRRAYDAMTIGEGLRADTVDQAIDSAYGSYRTPDGGEMTDEYIPPTIINGFSGMTDGDSVINFNYRQDRAIQLTRMFVDDSCSYRPRDRLNVTYCGLTRYYDEFPFYLLEPISDTLPNVLGKVISDNGLRQLRISETQKYRHVTSFFNGKQIEPYVGEDRIEIKSMYDPATYAEHPEMNALDVTDEVVRQVERTVHDFILVNLANCDMVGHTGNYQSAITAVEVVDACVGIMAREVISHSGIALITADHGNAEEMYDFARCSPKTSHTTNPVEFVYVADDYCNIRLRPRGILSDIAPTVLHLKGLEKPTEMSSRTLIYT